MLTLSNLSKDIRSSKEPRPKKIAKLRAWISDPKNGLLSFPPLSLPLDPSIQVTGTSSLMEALFRTSLYLSFSPPYIRTRSRKSRNFQEWQVSKWEITLSSQSPLPLFYVSWRQRIPSHLQDGWWFTSRSTHCSAHHIDGSVRGSLSLERERERCSSHTLRLLGKENLDLRITPYKVLATGIDNGKEMKKSDPSLSRNVTIYSIESNCHHSLRI